MPFPSHLKVLGLIAMLLAAPIREISETITKSKDTAVMARGRVDAADQQAQKLNSAAQAIRGIIKLIGNLTGQINLLALNATIEKARAGEEQGIVTQDLSTNMPRRSAKLA